MQSHSAAGKGACPFCAKHPKGRSGKEVRCPLFPQTRGGGTCL